MRPNDWPRVHAEKGRRFFLILSIDFWRGLIQTAVILKKRARREKQSVVVEEEEGAKRRRIGLELAG